MNRLPIFLSVVDTAKEKGGVHILNDVRYGVNTLERTVHTEWERCRKHVANIVNDGAKNWLKIWGCDFAFYFAIAITSLSVNESVGLC